MTFFPILLRLLRALMSNELAPLGFRVNREILAGRSCASGRFREVRCGGPIGAIWTIIAVSAPPWGCAGARIRAQSPRSGFRDNAFHEPPETA